MQVTQGVRHVTYLQPDRYDENLIIGKQPCLLESNLQFLMAVSLLPVKCLREADHDNHAFEECPADLMLPILPGLESLGIQPDVDAIPDKTVIEFVDGFPVAVRVDKKNFRLLCCCHSQESVPRDHSGERGGENRKGIILEQVFQVKRHYVPFCFASRNTSSGSIPRWRLSPCRSRLNCERPNHSRKRVR